MGTIEYTTFRHYTVEVENGLKSLLIIKVVTIMITIIMTITKWIYKKYKII